jgi:hypothetical protein
MFRIGFFIGFLNGSKQPLLPGTIFWLNFNPVTGFYPAWITNIFNTTASGPDWPHLSA